MGLGLFGSLLGPCAWDSAGRIWLSDTRPLNERLNPWARGGRGRGGECKREDFLESYGQWGRVGDVGGGSENILTWKNLPEMPKKYGRQA